MFFGIGNSGRSQEHRPLLRQAKTKNPKDKLPRGLSLDRAVEESVINPLWQGTANGDAVPIDTMDNGAPDSAIATPLRRASVSAYLEAEKDSDEESDPEAVSEGLNEARESIAQLSESIGKETASDSVARVLAAQKIASRIFFSEKKWAHS